MIEWSKIRVVASWMVGDCTAEVAATLVVRMAWTKEFYRSGLFRLELESSILISS